MDRKRLKIAIDFDGVCMYNGFPVGEEVPNAVKYLQLLAEYHDLILWTCRSHLKAVDDYNPEGVDTLQVALDWFKDKNIPLFAVNSNPESDGVWTDSRKIYYDILIDDRAAFMPLLSKECIDWERLWLEYLMYKI